MSDGNAGAISAKKWQEGIEDRLGWVEMAKNQL
jgi:hypothetical protein